MTENLFALVAAVVVLVLLGFFAVLFFAGWLLKTFARETMRMVAQADERVSASWSYAEKQTSRAWATGYPENHKRFRELAGPVLDGAQQRPKQHYLDEENMKATLERERAAIQQDKLSNAIRAARAEPENIDVATQLGFERNGPV